jgi:hypothetical protein
MNHGSGDFLLHALTIATLAVGLSGATTMAFPAIPPAVSRVSLEALPKFLPRLVPIIVMPPTDLPDALVSAWPQLALPTP